MSSKEFFKVMDIRFKTAAELRKYTKYVNEHKPLKDFEQLWADHVFSPLIYLMGDHIIWNLLGVTVGHMKTKEVYPSPMGYHSGKHWYSRRAFDERNFDPYETYQIPGTNSFCQTFALMYAVGKIDRKQNSSGFTRYYVYAEQALKFIKHTIEILPPSYSFTWINDDIRDSFNHKLGLSRNNKIAKKQMIGKVQECLRHVNACINLAGASPKGLS
jgi:hypothetical protein